MPLESRLVVMQKFIDDHQSQYIGKYKHHSSYRVGDSDFKVHYYMYDENFRQLDIFIDLRVTDTISYRFSEELHEQEQIYIIKDLLGRLVTSLQYKSSLHYSLYEQCLNSMSVYNKDLILEPIDYISLLYYMKYHKGINQSTIDAYYKMFIPCLESLIRSKHYKKFMESINYLLGVILYSYEWEGTNSKYLDTEYQYHLYYIREIIRLVYQHLDQFYKNVPDELIKAIITLCQNGRFSLAIMTDFGNLVLSHYQVCLAIMNKLKEELVLCKKGETYKDENLIFSYIYYIFISDYDEYYAVVIKLMRNVVHNMLVFANHDLDLALGNSLVKEEGYQVLLDLFEEDYNTFIFSCFPISSFPNELHLRVRDELVTAIQYFAARMENDNYRLSSFEQVENINRLLIENFREWYK